MPDGDAVGVVAFAHGSGSSRHSPRNRQVARALVDAGLATLLIDLLTPAEEAEDARTGALRFDIGLLGERVVGAVDWLRAHPQLGGLALGLFGASTGAAAALVAGAQRREEVAAIVSRGGRPDLAGDALPAVRAPTLLIVGERDPDVLELNQRAARQMTPAPQIQIVPGASHLFEEPGTLDRVTDLARDWFLRHLGSATTTEQTGGT